MPSPAQAAMMHRNRYRALIGPKAGIALARALARKQCSERGHAWGQGFCQRCAAIDPAVIAFDATGKASVNESQTQTP